MQNVLESTDHEVAAEVYNKGSERDAFEVLLPYLANRFQAEHIWSWKRDGERFRLLCRTCQNASESSLPFEIDDPGLHKKLDQAAEKMETVGFHVEVPNTNDNSTWELSIAPLTFKGALYVIVVAVTSIEATLNQTRSLREFFRLFPDQECSIDSTVNLRLSDDSVFAQRCTQDDQTASLPRTSLSDYVHSLNGTLLLDDSVTRIANETRRYLDCDRVSVFTEHRGKFNLSAISGQSSVNRRSNVAIRLQRLANVILKTRCEFRYPDDTSNTSPQVEQELEGYLSIGKSSAIVVIPILDMTNDLDGHSDEQRNAKTLGGLVIESFRDQSIGEQTLRQLDYVKIHVADCLRNCNEHQSIFLLPVWSFIGRSFAQLTRNLSLFLLGTLITLTSVASLFLFTCDHTVRVSGHLVPKIRKNVFACVDGKISETHIQHGQKVRTGDVLVEMESHELESRLADASGRLKTQLERIKVLELTGLGGARNDNQRHSSASAGLASLRAETDVLKEQVRLLNGMKDSLTITAPIDGDVLTWDPQQRLQGRPVARGELLVEIADSAGPWQIELQIPESRIGRILEAHRQSSKPLQVSSVLATNPDVRYDGVLREISSSVQLSTNRTQTVKAYVDFPTLSPQVDVRQVRSGVVAKINCGETTIAASLFSDLIDVVESEILFRIW